MCVCVGVCWVHVCLHGNSINQHIDKVQFMVNQSFFNEWTNNTNNKRNVCNSSTQRYRMLQLLIYHWRVNVYTRYYAHLLVCIFILPAISNSCNIHMWQTWFFRQCGIFVAATSFNNAGAYLHNCHATNATICVYWLPVMAGICVYFCCCCFVLFGNINLYGFCDGFIAAHVLANTFAYEVKVLWNLQKILDKGGPNIWNLILFSVLLDKAL